MYNKSQLIGRLGRDPDVRFTGEGKAVANLAVATTETWKDKVSGERKQKYRMASCRSFWSAR